VPPLDDLVSGNQQEAASRLAKPGAVIPRGDNELARGTGHALEEGLQKVVFGHKKRAQGSGHRLKWSPNPAINHVIAVSRSPERSVGGSVAISPFP